MSWIIDHPNLLGMLEEVLDPSEGQLEVEEDEVEEEVESAQNQTGVESSLITELLETEEVSVERHWSCLLHMHINILFFYG